MLCRGIIPGKIERHMIILMPLRPANSVEVRSISVDAARKHNAIYETNSKFDSVTRLK
jgi:hypothetical protein